MDGMFITLPTALDVKLCFMMYALFINDEKQIERNCIIKTIN